MDKREMRKRLKSAIGDYIRRYPQSDFVHSVKREVEMVIADARMMKGGRPRMTDAETARLNRELIDFAEMLEREGSA